MSPRSLTPSVNQMMTIPKISLTIMGIDNPSLCLITAFTGGKKSKESRMKTAPGTGCTNNRFDMPIANTTRPNNQLIIFNVIMQAFTIFIIPVNRSLNCATGNCA